jgi:hypothetical protein
MIKSKTAQIIDARKGLSEIVFFTIPTVMFNYSGDQVKVDVQTSTDEAAEGEDQRLVPFGSPITVDWTVAEFFALFGTTSLNDFNTNKYELLKVEIDKANKGEGGYDNKVWDLKLADLENA